ncbi:ribonuclease P protein subunit p25-like protein [Sander lucioperca]|uniref:Ribonuclease P/MRP 25 subunit-like n=1 Tax=Sander lucioperca TaxID=283035 RepID=A0A8D0CQW8_SANLU|nr:ribonuclease P protein subunit p25-like protein [Sander lucioperca]
MENYSKARTVEQPCVCPFPGLPPDTPEVRVKDGSKIRNLLRYALSRVEAKPRPAAEDGGVAALGQPEAAGRPLCQHIVFTATGKGVSKAVTCVEIVKRRVKGLHQLTRLLFSRVDEVWEPLEPAAGLDSLTVSRNVPAIWILLCREPLDASQHGYQAPGCYDALWAQAASREEAGGLSGQRPGHKRKKGGGGGGGRGGGGGGRGRGLGRQTGRPREPPKGQS